MTVLEALQAHPGTIRTGDCLEVMAGLPENSVDAIVTDPPYGLEFMGKEWDRLAPTTGRSSLRPSDESTGPMKSEFKAGVGTRMGAPQKNPRCRKCGKLQFDHPKGKCKCEVPNFDTRQSEYAFLNQVWHERWATEALRVAKPGAYLLAFGGTRTYHRLAVAVEDAGWIIRDCLVWAYASGFPKSKALLKPAWEPIVMARKPGPLRELAIDACRIPSPDADLDAVQRQSDPSTFQGRGGNVQPMYSPAGRWPANVLLTDPIFDGDVDGVVGGGEAAGGTNISIRRSHVPSGVWSGSVEYEETGYGDTGTYSRFFLIPKAARSEREPVFAGATNERVVSVWGGDEDDLTPGKKSTIPRRNNHPTVKPLDLMRHLVRLVTPVGGVCLDPFLGSGTTAIAAEMEGFAWIGIEREESYVEIARARLMGVQKGLGLAG